MRFRGSLELYEIKILKGPDRLMRLKFIIKGSSDLNNEFEMLNEIANALLLKHHNTSVELPIGELVNSIPQATSNHLYKYGQLFSGVLGVELLLSKYKPCEFEMRYYPEDLEFERHWSRIDSFVTLNKVDMESYEPKYTVGNMREGFNLPKIETKLKFE